MKHGYSIFCLVLLMVLAASAVGHKSILPDMLWPHPIYNPMSELRKHERIETFIQKCRTDRDCEGEDRCQYLQNGGGQCKHLCALGPCGEIGADVDRRDIICKVNRSKNGSVSAACACRRDHSGQYPKCRAKNGWSASGKDEKALCTGACGEVAKCKIIGTTAVCECPPHTIGDPFKKCRRDSTTVLL